MVEYFYRWRCSGATCCKEEEGECDQKEDDRYPLHGKSIFRPARILRRYCAAIALRSFLMRHPAPSLPEDRPEKGMVELISLLATSREGTRGVWVAQPSLCLQNRARKQTEKKWVLLPSFLSGSLLVRQAFASRLTWRYPRRHAGNAVCPVSPDPAS